MANVSDCLASALTALCDEHDGEAIDDTTILLYGSYTVTVAGYFISDGEIIPCFDVSYQGMYCVQRGTNLDAAQVSGFITLIGGE